MSRARVALASGDVIRAKAMVHALKQGPSGFVIAANLSVGGNARKRIPGDFELNLVRGLIGEGSAVITIQATADRAGQSTSLARVIDAYARLREAARRPSGRST